MKIEINREDWIWSQFSECAIVKCPVNDCTTDNCQQCEYCEDLQNEARRLEKEEPEKVPTRWDFSDEEIYPFWLWKPESEWNEIERFLVDIKAYQLEAGEKLLSTIDTKYTYIKLDQIRSNPKNKIFLSEIVSTAGNWLRDICIIHDYYDNYDKDEKWKIRAIKEGIPFRKEVIKKCYAFLNDYEKEYIIQKLNQYKGTKRMKRLPENFMQELIIPYIKNLNQ